LFFELILQGEEDEHRPFSAVTITSRLGSNPLTGGFFVSGGMASDSTPFRRTASTGIRSE
jgi:hypothetical protein